MDATAKHKHEDEPSFDDLSTREHRKLIGIIGLLTTPLLYVFSAWRSIESPWALQKSISAYYYTGAVAIFTGMLFALGLFLITYRGYDNKFYLRDRIASSIAGIAAIIVALFPTSAPNEQLKLSWWWDPSFYIHHVAAAILFACFIFIALFQFPKSKIKQWDDLPQDKKNRNVIFYVCGAVMSLAMLWAILAGRAEGKIFWPETVALVAFSISWLVKGRIDEDIYNAYKKAKEQSSSSGKAIKKLFRVNQS